jgi:hypothetical protein
MIKTELNMNLRCKKNLLRFIEIEHGKSPALATTAFTA